MSSALAVLRAMIWGALLLTELALIGVGIFASYGVIGRYRSAEFSTSAQQTLREIEKDIARYDSLHSTYRYSYDIKANVVSDQTAAEMRTILDGIETKTRPFCRIGNCESRSDSIYSEERDYIGLAGWRWLFALRQQLGFQSNPEHNRERNQEVLAQTFAGLIVVALSLALIICLARYQRLGWKKIALNHLLVLPFISMSLVVILLKENHRLDYLDIWNVIDALQKFVLYVFIVYPALVVAARRAGISITDSLRFWR
jgi:hypothetical protein